MVVRFHIDKIDTITDLNPYQSYDFRIKLRSAANIETNEESLWSKPKRLLKIRTNSAVPNISPEIIPGAYFISENETLTIFWRRIKPINQHGPKFTYLVSMNNGYVRVLLVSD